MIEIPALLIVPLSFIAYVLKGVATFGPGIILAPLGALLIGVKEIVIVISFLDLISNASLVRLNRDLLKASFLLPMIMMIILGSALGAAMLALLPSTYFDLVFGLILLPLGLWTLIAGGRSQTSSNSNLIAAKPDKTDLGVSFLSGCMSGLSGITGPVLAWHLGKTCTREVFRSIMIPILLVSAVARVCVYTVSGSVSVEVLILVLMALPGLGLGLWIGNRLFLQISQVWFSRIVGGLIAISGIKLLLR
jgi:uncharacterized membrane protein YfcA